MNQQTLFSEPIDPQAITLRWQQTHNLPKMRQRLTLHGWRPFGRNTYSHPRYWGLVEIDPDSTGWGWMHFYNQDVFGSGRASDLAYHESLGQHLASLTHD